MQSLSDMASGQMGDDTMFKRRKQSPTFGGFGSQDGSQGYAPPMQAGYGQVGQQDGQGGGMHPIQQAANMMMDNGVHPSYLNPILQAHGFQQMQ